MKNIAIAAIMVPKWDVTILVYSCHPLPSMILSRSASPSVTSEQDIRDEERRQVRRHAEYLKQKRREIAEIHRQRELVQLAAIQTKREQWKAASARYYERHPEVKEKKRQKMAEKRAAKKLARRRWDPPKLSKKIKPSRIVGDAHPPSAQHQNREQQQLAEFTARPDIDLSPDEHCSLASTPYEDMLDFFGRSLKNMNAHPHSGSEEALSENFAHTPHRKTLADQVQSSEWAAAESLLFLCVQRADALAAVPSDSFPDISRRQPAAVQTSNGPRSEDAWATLAPSYDSSEND
ncbi:hypothetical protein B0H13DRAFT_2335449 [Mycena leptocephala]|nr:hypothetical protein B0H13DRAFT_2335449 [Mycena leptocephala]